MYDDNTPSPAPTYRPEKPNHVRTGVKTLFFMAIYHAVTWLLYVLIMSPVENQMLGDEHEPEYRMVMFGFSLLTLLVIAIVMTVFYFKNGDRKRAYLAATSVEVRGEGSIAEGFARELVSKIQNLRKERNFEVTDRINITYDIPADWQEEIQRRVNERIAALSSCRICS